MVCNKGLWPRVNSGMGENPSRIASIIEDPLRREGSWDLVWFAIRLVVWALLFWVWWGRP
jgi:hypothetical protein